MVSPVIRASGNSTTNRSSHIDNSCAKNRRVVLVELTLKEFEASICGGASIFRVSRIPFSG